MANELRPASTPKRRGHGQVMVIFAGAMLVMTLMMAIVIDLSWLWSSALKVQRAADAAALAGAVALPKDAARGYSLAHKEAIKNGYRNGVDGVSVIPSWNPQANPYRMNVQLKVPVGMFFMRVVGLTSFDITRTARAEFNLPLKMGSPQQWYGVGTFEKLNRIQAPDVPGPTTSTGFRIHGSTPAGVWTDPENADDLNNNAYAVSTTIDDAPQQWGQFDLTTTGTAIPTGAVIEGIEVRFRALTTGSDTPISGCELETDLSWNNGADWTTTPVTQVLTDSEVEYTVGSPTSLADWPRATGTWAFSSFTNANFRVRMTWSKPSCGADREASVDTLAVRVWFHPMLPGPITYEPDPDTSVPTPPGETVAPTSQGFWGAIITAGGVRQNGDRYAPRWNSGGSSATNAEHVDQGYDYIVEIGGGNGRIHLFDPVFCATGRNPAGSGNYGAGDHWTALPASGTPNGPVTTEFTLYNTNGTVLDTTDDSQLATNSYTSRASDQSGLFDDPADGSGRGDIPTGVPIGDCQNDPAHNQWITIRNGLSSGTYRVNVNSSNPSNGGTAAENLWSIYVGSSGGPGSARVYGLARMAAYTNLTGTAARQEFYLAQIGKEHAGKTMQIRIFDPGDVAGNASLRIKSPDGGSYNYATFDFQADNQCRAGISDSCSASGRQVIRSAIGGASSFDNTVISLNITLPIGYGSGGLTPSTESEPGWWKIEYEVGAAEDTTTWEVSILENPVHLVVE